MKTIIGITGAIGVGKDTLASILVQDYGYKRIGFADILREVLYALNPIIADSKRLQDYVDQYGWEVVKRDYPEVRRLLQAMGTEVGRNIIDRAVWVDKTFDKIRSTYIQKWVISDVRFNNEASAIRNQQGKVFRLLREGYQAASTEHISEAGVSDRFIHKDLISTGKASLHDIAKSIHENF